LVDQTEQLGGDVWPQVSCRPLTIRVALDNPVALGTIPSLREVLAVPAADRAACYRDPAWRDRFRHDIDATWGPILERAVALVDGAADPADGIAVASCAAARSIGVADAFVDLALEHGLATRFDIPVANLDEIELAGLLSDRRTIIGLSDAGAHANQQCDASFATYLLGYWCRERGVLSLEEAVWRLTGQPASVYRFSDRGVVRVGAVADLVAFDADTVAALPLEHVEDLPGGAERLVSRSNGIDSIWVSGVASRRDGRDLDERAGVLIRAAVAR
jgi:N-acyl-D-aspartate/D-glutamate deacylase